MDPWLGRVADGLPGPIDIVFGCAGQRGDFGPFQFAGNPGNCLQITIGSRRKSRLQNIDAQFFQLDGQSQLFSGIHAGAGRLLTVS